MIQLENITKRFGPQVLFEDLSWHIRPGERVGLVGPNGAGKTTLLRILAGLEPPDEGRVRQTRRARIGYLPQEVMELSGGSILEEALAGHGELTEMERTMHRIAHRLAEHPPADEATKLTEEYGHLQDRFTTLGGYELESRAAAVLTGLGFDPERLDRPIAELSGGWQMRVALARLLLQDPDLLLLDEPTNHLDLPSLEWIENYLRERAGAFVVVSHDRYFLNRMVGRIAEVAGGTVTLYTGNYDAFLVEREARFAQVDATARNQEKEIERITRFVERFRYQATKARQVQSRLKLLDKMERIQAPVRDTQTIRFQFPQPPRSGAVAAELTDVVKRYGDHVVYDGMSFRLQRGDRVALVGPNGAGKSTLLKILAGALPIEGGRRALGHNVTLAYYSQHALDILDPRQTVLGEISGAAEIAMQPKVRGILAAFLFDDEEWEKPIAVLSGGEKARLALAKLLLRPSNLLLLDEPTNHLDLQSRGVLEEALAGFTGTIAFISHDRYFINRVATSVCAVDAGRLDIHLGTYDDYRARAAPAAGARPAGPRAPARLPASEPASPAAAPAATTGREAASTAESRPRTREEKRREAELRQRFAAATRALRTDIERAEGRIAEDEKKLRAVEFELASPATYQNPAKAKGAAKLRAEIQERLEALNREWEALSEKMAAAERDFRRLAAPAGKS